MTSAHQYDRPRKVSLTGKKVKRFIFTCAVRGASVHHDFLKNLEAYAKHIGAEIVIGTLTGTRSINGSNSAKYATFKPEDFPEELRDYLDEDAIVLGDKARYCPELRLTPTAAKPLSALQTYTKQLWGIFPHPKICVETIPTHKNTPAKFNFTTGAVTHAEYSLTKAGNKARFDHMVGALLVEVSKHGIWPRYLLPTDETDGSFYDLDNVVTGEMVLKHGGVAAIAYGDVHVEQIDPVCARATWGYNDHKYEGSLAHVLKPDKQIFHDLLDNRGANHHEMNDGFSRYKSWWNDTACVSSDYIKALDFMEHVVMLGQDNIVVDSNHDYFIKKWMLSFDPMQREDFTNAHTYYELKLALLEAIRNGEDDTSLLEMTLRKLTEHRPTSSSTIDHFTFLKRDERFNYLNVEFSYHGHYGPNGSRGSRSAFVRTNERVTIGHSHAPGIESGCHQVGTSSKLDLGYNNGASSWAHTHDVMYPNGTRTLVTLSDGRFWADQG